MHQFRNREGHRTLDIDATKLLLSTGLNEIVK